MRDKEWRGAHTTGALSEGSYVRYGWDGYEAERVKAASERT